MKKTWIKLVSLLIVTLLALSGVAIAETAGTAEVIFSATEKADDIIELDVIVKNATFRGMQVAVRYDKNVVVPVNESGETVTEFKGFAERSAESIVFSTAGLLLEADKGLFGFTVFVMPGISDENITSLGEYIVGEDGINLYKFRFKKLLEGDPAFEIAFEDGIKPYQGALKEGFIISNAAGKPETTVTFVYDEEEQRQTTVISQAATTPEKTEPVFTSEDRKKDVIMLQIGKNLAVSYNKKVKIDPDNDGVVPYITNDRTLVPIRFVAETLGTEVLWEEGWKYCIIKKDDKEIKLNFNSAEFEVNGEKIFFDAPVELKFDRTMVPLRFVSEHLGCDVYWNDANKAVVLSPADNPWQEERESEITALNEMLVTLLPIMQ